MRRFPVVLGGFLGLPQGFRGCGSGPWMNSGDGDSRIRAGSGARFDVGSAS